jgi:hypothetical protein
MFLVVLLGEVFLFSIWSFNWVEARDATLYSHFGEKREVRTFRLLQNPPA